MTIILNNAWSNDNKMDLTNFQNKKNLVINLMINPTIDQHMINPKHKNKNMFQHMTITHNHVTHKSNFYCNM